MRTELGFPFLPAPLDTRAEAHRPRVVPAFGGVGANQELRGRLTAWGELRGIEVVLPPPALTTDNAVMIAWAGQLRARRGLLDDPRSLRAYPRAPWKAGADRKGRPAFPAL